jgi:hypothetical protein
VGTATKRVARFLMAATVTAATALGLSSRAAALPPGFPDLDSFATLPVDPYIVIGPKGPRRFVNFCTPYNIECSFIATTDPVPAGSSRGVHCSGEIPGLASGPTPTESCAIGAIGESGAAGFRIERELANCPIGSFASGPLLRAGHKLTYQDVTCAVGNDGLIACLDTSLGQHGFVLRPAGNLTF